VVKVLSQAGSSLADVYDVVGSIAGIEELISRDVQLIHEMGGTVFSERLGSSVRRVSTGAINQSTTWDLITSNLPEGVTRIWSATVIATIGSRIDSCQLSIRNANQERETPLMVWDGTLDSTVDYRTVDNGGAVTVFSLLRPVDNLGNLPGMLTNNGHSPAFHTESIAFRGLTTAFGAGTVEAIALLLLGLSDTVGLSAAGLPVPSW